MTFSKVSFVCLLAAQLTTGFSNTQDFIYSENYREEDYTISTVGYGDRYIEPISEIRAIHGKGWVIELDNGSMWRATDSNSASKIDLWYSSDEIVIYPRYFEGNSRFYCENINTKETANIECFLGSSINSPLRVLIHSISLFDGQLCTSDQSGRMNIFECSSFSKISSWCCGDSIYILANRGSFSGWGSPYDYIIYNFTTDELVTANLRR